ncbi:MAG: mannose-1-phosphate guanyltransferase [Actinobacteria bacterium]|nr:mannose-1-phosphate guanyltransferase [Actinomycetota bacterium]
MKAVVMAGGEGTRLRPITSNQPKPMVPVLNKPVMEYILDLLRAKGIDDIVVTLQFLPQLIKNYFGKGVDLGVNLNYSVEEYPLGTAGSVKKAEGYLKSESFIVVSGDALTDFDLTYLIEFHRSKGSMATIALKRVENPLEFGVVFTDDEGKIERFLEKPTWGQVFSDTVNTGIYVLEPEVFQFIPGDGEYDFSKDVFPKLLEAEEPVFGCVMDGYWCDIGNCEQYIRAHRNILDGLAGIKPPGVLLRENIWVGDGADIDLDVEMMGPVVIGQNTKIEAGADIGEYSVIGNNAIVKSGAHVHRSIVWDNSYLGPHSFVHGCVIGKNCDIGAGARLDEGVVIGNETRIGGNAVINPYVQIYPFKRIDEGAVVNTSIIWESRGMRSLFGKNGIRGLLNIDITAGYALRLAMAYGTSLKKDSSVAISQDTSRASRMLKRAMVAGLNSTGVDVNDMRIATSAMNRFHIRTSECIGGIHIRTSPFDPQSVEVHFFDRNGIDIDEGIQRSIERHFFREEFRRTYYNEIGEISFPLRTIEAYRGSLVRGLNVEKIRESRFKVVIDFCFGSASLLIPHLIGQVGCDVISINNFIDETKNTLSKEELDGALKQLSRTVRAFNADFGLLMDSGGEKVMVIDERGELIVSDSLLHLLLEFVGRLDKKKGKIAVPIDASSVVETIADRWGRKVVRTKANVRALMDAAIKSEVAYVGSRDGGHIFPQFLPAFDGIVTFLKLLEYLATLGKPPLSKMVKELPEHYMAKKSTFCSWDHKGLVMRKIKESASDKTVQILDGVKIYGNEGWTLILPDPEEPVVHVCAEAKSGREADELADEYVQLVNTIVASE